MAAAVAAERRLEVAEFRELNRIGVNLNQMARVLNSGAGGVARDPQPADELGRSGGRGDGGHHGGGLPGEAAGLGEGKPASGALAVPIAR